MQFAYRVLLLFLIITGATTVLIDLFDVQYGQVSFWYHHGFFFLLFITLFPRLTLLFSSVATGGVLWWLGWLFAPRLLVAILATIAYWRTNPILVMLSWAIALGGESSEKTFIIKGSPRFRYKQSFTYTTKSPKESPLLDKETIEADFRDITQK